MKSKNRQRENMTKRSNSVILRMDLATIVGIVLVVLMVLGIMPILATVSTSISVSDALTTLGQHGYVAYANPVGNLIVTGDINCSGNADVTGNLTVNQDVKISDDLQVDDDVTILGNGSIGGNLGVTGWISAANGTVGNWNITGNANITGTLDAATGRTATYVIASANSSSIVKLQADVVVSGVAEDDIQSVITLANVTNTNGASIYLPSGRYVISSPVYTCNNLTFWGDGDQTEIYLADNADCNMFEVRGANNTFRNIRFNGNRNNQSADYKGSIHIDIPTKNLTVEGCTFANCLNSGIYGDASSGCIIDGIRVINCRAYNMRSDATQDDAVVWINRGNNTYINGLRTFDIGSATKKVDTINIWRSLNSDISNVDMFNTSGHGVMVAYGCNNTNINNIYFEATIYSLEAVSCEFARDGTHTSISGRNNNLNISNVQHINRYDGNYGLYISAYNNVNVNNYIVKRPVMTADSNPFYVRDSTGVALHNTSFVGYSTTTVYNFHNVDDLTLTKVKAVNVKNTAADSPTNTITLDSTCERVIIDGAIIDQTMGHSGIESNANECLITNCIIYNLGKSGISGDSKYAILVKGNNTSVSNNILKAGNSTKMKGILITTSGDNSKIYDNQLIGGFQNNVKLLDQGADNTIIEDNIGYITEARGSSVGTGANQTIAHGMKVKPNVIHLMGNNTNANCYCSGNPDTTNIYVTCDAGEAFNWYAVKEY